MIKTPNSQIKKKIEKDRNLILYEGIGPQLFTKIIIIFISASQKRAITWINIDLTNP